MTVTTELLEQKLAISYDTEARAAYIRLKDGRAARTVEEVANRINLDFNARGELIGVEIFQPALSPAKLGVILKKIAKKHSVPPLAHLHPSALPHLYSIA
jgi:uncharacterized protein YuzE